MFVHGSPFTIVQPFNYVVALVASLLSESTGNNSSESTDTQPRKICDPNTNS